MSFQAIQTKDLSKQKKALQEEYVQACREWKRAAKEAGSDGDKPPRPKKPALKVFGSKFAGKDAKKKAEELVAKCEAKYEEKMQKKQEAEETKPDADDKTAKKT